ncbi:COMM domain-containing protein 1 isoform 2-T2 [Spheniscus humboldti]
MDLNQLEAFLTAQTKKQGGITSDQAAVIAKFWKNHRIKIHESLINQSRWDNVLKNMNWRVDLKSQSRHIDQINTPVAIVEMELGKNGQETRMSKGASDPVSFETPPDFWLAVTVIATVLQSGTMVILNTVTLPACTCQIIFIRFFFFYCFDSKMIKQQAYLIPAAMSMLFTLEETNF